MSQPDEKRPVEGLIASLDEEYHMDPETGERSGDPEDWGVYLTYEWPIIRDQLERYREALRRVRIYFEDRPSSDADHETALFIIDGVLEGREAEGESNG